MDKNNLIAMLENNLAHTKSENHKLVMESAKLRNDLLDSKEVANDFAISLSMAGKELNDLGAEGSYYRDKGYNYIESLKNEI